MATYNAHATHPRCKTCKFRRSWTICQCCDGYIYYEQSPEPKQPKTEQK